MRLKFRIFSDLREEDVEKSVAREQRTAGGAIPPEYEYIIEPELYFAGLLVCLLACLCILWALFQGEITAHRLLVASAMWTVLGICCYKALQGVRYGTSVRLYRGHLEIATMSPPEIITKQEVVHFHDKYYDQPLRRRIYLFLRSGDRRRLPRVSDPDKLSRGLHDIVGFDRLFQ